MNTNHSECCLVTTKNVRCAGWAFFIPSRLNPAQSHGATYVPHILWKPEHWPNVMRVLMAGGGLKTGQVIGETERLAQEATERKMDLQHVFCSRLPATGDRCRHHVDGSQWPSPILTRPPRADSGIDLAQEKRNAPRVRIHQGATCSVERLPGACGSYAAE